MDGRAELARRVAELDDGPWYRQGDPSLHEALTDFMDAMGRITSTGMEPDFHRLPRATPADADAIVSGSRVLTRLADGMPEIVTGPLRLDAQHWVSTGAPSWAPTRAPIMDEAHFVGASEAHDIELSTKPFRVGLFTSTGVLGTHGMWRLYLERDRGSTLHPLPWHTWAVEVHPDVRVFEIASAAQWVDFVTAFPRWSGRMLFPDWKSVAQRYDAVHMTLRAIAATQGLFFPAGHGEVAPTFWDIESTFWLRWRFASVQLVETIARGGPPRGP